MSSIDVIKLRGHTGLGLMDCKNALRRSKGNFEEALKELQKLSSVQSLRVANRDTNEGVIMSRSSGEGSYGVMVEVSCETETTAKSSVFIDFSKSVTDASFSLRETNVGALISTDLESARQELMYKMGENICVRRACLVEAKSGVVGSYVHANGHIAVLVALTIDELDLAHDIAIHIAASNPWAISIEDIDLRVLNAARAKYSTQMRENGVLPRVAKKMVDRYLESFATENSLINQRYVKNLDMTVGDLLRESGAKIVSFTRLELGKRLINDP